MTRPLFLLALPRSGSTVLQRRLAAHPQIATAAEPWLLLPLLLARQADMVIGVHDQTMMARALDDLIARLPGGSADWDAAVRAFAAAIHARLARNGEAYFLDKTPRYCLVARALVQGFPDARFILLHRDPVAVVQSINDTWGQGRWAVPRHEADLFTGLAELCAAGELLGERAWRLRYEDLLADPGGEMARLFAWLGLDPAEAGPADDGAALAGRMGDPRRHGDDGRIRPRSPDWRRRPLNPLRRRWLRRYLRWIGEARLARMGYRLDGLLADLAAAPLGWDRLGSDAMRMALAPPYHVFDWPALRPRLRALARGERCHVRR